MFESRGSEEGALSDWLGTGGELEGCSRPGGIVAARCGVDNGKRGPCVIVVAWGF